MEYTQWVIESRLSDTLEEVLILVVMEYTQWVHFINNQKLRTTRLNPCCNGIYSMSYLTQAKYTCLKVLILVVMEYTQWVGHNYVVNPDAPVLILVVMEYTQWEKDYLLMEENKKS